MPKEHLYYRPYGGRNLDTGERVPDPDPRRVSVGWSREYGHVQVGIGWIEPGMTKDDLPAHLRGHADHDMQSGETDEQGRVWRSQWVDADRHFINDLIRLLRKARDAAMGKDE